MCVLLTAPRPSRHLLQPCVAASCTPSCLWCILHSRCGDLVADLSSRPPLSCVIAKLHMLTAPLILCATQETRFSYKAGIKYAIQTIGNAVPEVAMYLEAGTPPDVHNSVFACPGANSTTMARRKCHVHAIFILVRRHLVLRHREWDAHVECGIH